MNKRLVLTALNLVASAALLVASEPIPPARMGQSLWEVWPRVRVSPPDPWSLKHTGLGAALQQLQYRHPGLVSLAEEGHSSEGRRIPLLRLGTGPKGILLWSQMHGDEPTATAALLDLINWLGTDPSDPTAQSILANLTLWIIPMLNPDGAERTQRWNAQGIDINRDALRLSTPEGRFLKEVRDRHKPAIGFNLHNQNPLLLAGKTGRQVAISVLSVPGDELDSENAGTKQTRQLAVRVQQLVQTQASGRVSRYDTDYTARAFGDSMTRWGTPTLLIETGGWAGPGEAERLVRLNFVALLGSLSALADGSIAATNPHDYAKIPLNVRDSIASLVVRNARLASGRGLPPFKADLSFVVPGPFAGDAPRPRSPALLEVGDLTHLHGLLELDATGMLAVPWPAPAGMGWLSLKESLRAQDLAVAGEARLLAAAAAQGESAVAGPGYAGAVLLYRTGEGPLLKLYGAVIAGRLVGESPDSAHTP